MQLGVDRGAISEIIRAPFKGKHISDGIPYVGKRKLSVVKKTTYPPKDLGDRSHRRDC